MNDATQKNRKKVSMSMVVEQYFNPKWAGDDPDMEYSYRVIKTVNLLDSEAAIGKYLTMRQLQSWIDFGVQVTVQQVK